MGLGVLESKTPGHVPGTALLDQEAAHSEARTSDLKHGLGKDNHIVLVPQPSEDPNDPLNWSFFQKHLVYFIICLGTIVQSAAPAPILTAGTVQIATELNVPVTDMVKLTGYLQLATAAVGPLVATLARKYGKRPAFLFSSLLGVIACIIGECAQDYNTLLANRIIAGMAQTAYEALVMACIGDLFFVHERGPRMAVALFVTTAVAFGVNIIAGPITTNLGWHYNFHILVPFSAFQFILTVLFLPETTYRRSAIYNLDTAGSDEKIDKLGELARARKGPGVIVELKNVEWTSASESLSIPARKTMFQRMAIYNGSFVEDSVWKILLSFPAIFLNVGGSFVIFSTGILFSWYVSALLLNSVLLAGPPYMFSSGQVGYASAGPLIGSLVACVFMGAISDPFIKFLTRRNRGVFEPEFQLPLSLFGAICAISGLVGLGYSLQRGENVYLVCFVWGLLSFGVTVSNVSYFNYGLAAFREYSTETFIMASVFRNFFGYGIANFLVNWLVAGGVINVCGTMAGILAAFSLLAIPFYIFGKRYRQFWYHHNLYKILHLETDKTGVAEA